jgi:hypothetical protein
MNTPQLTPEIKPETPSYIRAADYIFMAAFSYTLLPIVAIGLINEFNKDEYFFLVACVCIFFLVFCLPLWTAGILLYNKSKIGLYIWLPTSIIVLLSFPLGTLIGVLAYMHLLQPDVMDELR